MARRSTGLIGLAARRSAALGAAALGAAMVGAAAADEPPTLETTLSGAAPAVDAGAFRISGEVLYTPQGTPVTVFHYFAVGPDCAQRPVSITVTDPPAHGRLALTDGAEPAVYGGRPLWADNDPRVRCLDRLVPTRDGAYAPDPGFSGHDQLTVTFKEGEASFTDAIEINVVTLAPTPPTPSSKPHKPHPAARAAADKAKTATP